MNPINVLVITPEGKVSTRKITEFEHLQGIVNGFVQLINFGFGANAYINEEGKLDGLENNDLATYLCKLRGVGLLEDDYIVGPMIVVGLDDEDGFPTSCNEELASVIIEIARLSDKIPGIGYTMTS